MALPWYTARHSDAAQAPGAQGQTHKVGQPSLSRAALPWQAPPAFITPSVLLVNKEYLQSKKHPRKPPSNLGDYYWYFQLIYVPAQFASAMPLQHNVRLHSTCRALPETKLMNARVGSWEEDHCTARNSGSLFIIQQEITMVCLLCIDWIAAQQVFQEPLSGFSKCFVSVLF